MFHKNAFPDERIRRGPDLSEHICQPLNKAGLQVRMLRLKEQMNFLYVEAVASLHSGKTRHPGLGFFNAMEWLQFSEMHMRHHIRQKERIEEVLKHLQ